MEPSVVPTDASQPKMTLTPTRFVVKVPRSMPQEEVQLFVRFAIRVAEQVGPPSQALRGRLEGQGDVKFRTTLFTNSGVFKSFEEER